MALSADQKAALEAKATEIMGRAAAKVTEIQQRIEDAKAKYASSPAAADLQAIGAAVEQLVADVKAAMAARSGTTGADTA